MKAVYDERMMTPNRFEIIGLALAPISGWEGRQHGDRSVPALSGTVDAPVGKVSDLVGAETELGDDCL
mgnify:CR=1 FL=1